MIVLCSKYFVQDCLYEEVYRVGYKTSSNIESGVKGGGSLEL